MDLGDYVEVKDRLRMALAKYPDLTVLERPPQLFTAFEIEYLVCTVEVWATPEDARPVIASAWEPRGRTAYTRDSELMVGMTSALGRALGYMGFGISKSIASANEVKNRAPESPRIDETTPAGTQGAAKWNPENAASEKQKRAIWVIAKKHGVPLPDVDTMTMAEAGAWIEEMDKR